jgi:hypothetical protein
MQQQHKMYNTKTMISMSLQICNNILNTTNIIYFSSTTIYSLQCLQIEMKMKILI